MRFLTRKGEGGLLRVGGEWEVRRALLVVGREMMRVSLVWIIELCECEEAEGGIE